MSPPQSVPLPEGPPPDKRTESTEWVCGPALYDSGVYHDEDEA